MSATRVFLLDDHEIVRRGLRQLLEAEDGFTVVGEAGTAEEALTKIPATDPDVAVLDVRLPDGDGVEVCREIRSRHPQIDCLIFTSFADDEALFSAILAGAAGYVLCRCGARTWLTPSAAWPTASRCSTPRVTARVLDRLRTAQARDEMAGLTEQERRIPTWSPRD